MSTKAQVEELLAQAEAEIESLWDALSKADAKSGRKLADLKKKLKAKAEDTEIARQAGFDDAVEASDNLKKVARQEYAKLKSTDLNGLGIPGKVAVEAKMELLQKLFGGL